MEGGGRGGGGGNGLYACINMYLMDHQYTQGAAAMAMVRQLDARHWLALTEPGIMVGHAGHYFQANTAVPKKYTIVSGRSPKAVFFVTQQGLFTQKTYAVEAIATHG